MRDGGTIDSQLLQEEINTSYVAKLTLQGRLRGKMTTPLGMNNTPSSLTSDPEISTLRGCSLLNAS